MTGHLRSGLLSRSLKLVLEGYQNCLPKRDKKVNLVKRLVARTSLDCSQALVLVMVLVAQKCEFLLTDPSAYTISGPTCHPETSIS